MVNFMKMRRYRLTKIRTDTSVSLSDLVQVVGNI